MAMLEHLVRCPILVGALLMSVWHPLLAQPSTCLTTPATPAPEGVTYAYRDHRCEGVLPRYVGHGDNIELIGFFSGTFDARGPVAELYVAPTTAITAVLTVRALSLTSRLRYQMDARMGQDGKFRWPLMVLERARNDKNIALDMNSLGIVACSNRCSPRPDTVYFPMSSTQNPAGSRVGLSVRLRADVPATAVRLTLRPMAGGQAIENQFNRMTLTPDELTEMTLPALQPGEYRLDVRAINSESRQPMSPLLARILVP